MTEIVAALQRASKEAELQALQVRVAYLASVEAFAKLTGRLPGVREQAEIAGALVTAKQAAAARDALRMAGDNGSVLH
jgi:hypothetical protein